MAWFSNLGGIFSGSKEDATADSGLNHLESGGSHADLGDSQNFDPHLDRNLFQQGLAPEHMPDFDSHYDPNTGITWMADDTRSEGIWHGGYDCYRGDLPDQMVSDLHADPVYRDAFAQIAGDHGYNVDTMIPGAQVCYDEQGTIIDSGPHQGTWDYASPAEPGQSWAHLNLDVVPDYHADAYTHYDQAQPFDGSYLDDEGMGHMDAGYGGYDDHSAYDHYSSGDAGSGGGSSGSDNGGLD